MTPAIEDCSTLQDDDCNGLSNDHCALWTSALSGPGDQRVGGMASDAQGNIFVIGTFQGAASFGEKGLSSAGDTDVFVVKLSPDGVPLWSKQFGDELAQEGRAVAVDSKGNALITGVFQGSLALSGGVDAPSISSAGGRDVFVIKLDPGGGVVWGARFGGAASEDVRSIDVDNPGNTVIGGNFSGSFVLDKVGTLTSVDGRDGFVLKMSAKGEPVWAASFGGPGDDSIEGVATSKDERAFVTGYFHEQAQFGDAIVQTSAGDNAFVAEFGPSGKASWISALNGSSTQRGSQIAVDGAGDVVALGAFEGSLSVGDDVLLASGSTDLFVAKLSTKGQPLWGSALGVTQSGEPAGLAVGAAGEILIAASIEGEAFVGDSLFVSEGARDALLARLDPATGAPIWARRFGDFADQAGRAVAFTPAGGAVIAGDFMGTITLGGPGLVSSGGLDVFVAEVDR